MSVTAPESFGLDEMDEVREILEKGKFNRSGNQHFLWKFLGLTVEDKVVRSYENFKQSTGYTGGEAIQQYFMSAGLIAKKEPEYRKEGLFDLLYDSISEFEEASNESEPEENLSREKLESVYYNLEKL